jgi:hypothetical protein
VKSAKPKGTPMEFNTFHQYSRYCDAMPSSHTNSTLMFSYHAPAYSPLHPRWAEKWSVLLCEPQKLNVSPSCLTAPPRRRRPAGPPKRATARSGGLRGGSSARGSGRGVRSTILAQHVTRARVWLAIRRRKLCSACDEGHWSSVCIRRGAAFTFSSTKSHLPI